MLNNEQQAMGKNIIHCGDVGAGQVVKICNNLVLGISMVAISEAMNMGVRLGVDPKVIATDSWSILIISF